MITYPTAQLHVSASNRMVRKQQKMLSFSSGRKTPTEEKPTNQVGTENPFYMQSLR